MEIVHKLSDFHTLSSKLNQIFYKNTVIYHLKNLSPYGQTDLIMTPLEFIHKIASLLPPPGVHLLRYSGVLASNSSLRQEVIKSADTSVAMMKLMKEA